MAERGRSGIVRIVQSHRILVIDDHTGVRTRLVELFRDAVPEAEIGEAATAAEALRRWLAADWDIAILDLNLPDTTGCALVRQLATIRPSARIVVLSAMDPTVYAVPAVEAGAAVFVAKKDIAIALLPAALIWEEP